MSARPYIERTRGITATGPFTCRRLEFKVGLPLVTPRGHLLPERFVRDRVGHELWVERCLSLNAHQAFTE